MADQDSSHIELDELRRRWLDSPTPQASIQLAEAYRRRDRREEGVEVLEEVLRKNPEHLAARVALGRYQLELGELDAAARELETVVARDPTNLVANKLLVGLYLDMERPRQARDRLDLYVLLNSVDPEIELLEKRFAGGRDEDGVAGVAATLEADKVGPETIETEEVEPEAAAEIPKPEPVPLELSEPETPTDMGEELFGLGEAPPPPEFPPVVPDGPPEAAGDPFPGLWVDLEGAGSWWVPSPEAEVFELGPPAAVVVAGGDVTVGAVGEPEPPAEEAVPTVTLGRLYLDQGHLEEAEATFEAILEQDPGSEEATRGLATVRSRRAGWVTARELLRDADGLGDSPQERRAGLLQSYLRRLRSGARRE